ncbi:HD family phosphohydrolase [Gorillibacterium timonense]|uniref:HD family phosphohydrolase n=1 Tax=Gorillibacterium timonense TaxID=1689269 RepID=UPI00071DF0A0|nr:HDIG domain-containing metalloprotein [Gorillibacterium timonense]
MNRNVGAKSKTPQWMNGWKQSPFIRFFLYGLIALVSYVSLVDHVVPKTYDIQPNKVSAVTIVAPKQIKDEIGTEKAREEAAQKVSPVNRPISMRTDQLVVDLFDKLEFAVADQDMKFDEKVSYFRSAIPRVYEEHATDLVDAIEPGEDNDKLIEEMKKQLTEQEYSISEEGLYKLPRLTSEDLTAMEPVTREIVSKLMVEGNTDVSSVRMKVTAMVNSSALTKNTQRELVQELAKFSVLPNRFYDAGATEKARIAARESTEPVYIERNAVLVREGDMINQAMYERLEKAGLLHKETNYRPAFGLAIFVLLSTLLLLVQVKRSSNASISPNVQLLMLTILFVLTVAGLRLVALGQNLEFPMVGYLAPVAMGVMLTVILIDSRIAVSLSIVFSVVSAIVFNTNPDLLFDFRFGFVALVSCLTAVFSFARAGNRTAILKSGLIISLFACTAVLSLAFMEGNYDRLLYSLIYAFSSGIITAILVFGLIPFFETAFGILSPLKLVELSNPNHPLLRKLLTETPGTYHHSIMVGNLSEAAAEAIGADGLLCRVGSYYHDLGKTKRPSYFIENQMNMENPHDDIDPGLSMSIITAHPRDGVEMLLEYNIPKAIRDIAEQHHGTTLLKFFYYKAVKQQDENPERPVTEAEYRYPGPKAQSREAAIVGIADCVEAAVRSLKAPTIEQIDNMVRKIVKDRMDDGQFDECDLTIKELDTVSKALKEALLGIFHSRIEYPSDLPKPQGGTKNPNEVEAATISTSSKESKEGA